jgi:ABC-type multidrug transport system fused ATPase/permease subunit
MLTSVSLDFRVPTLSLTRNSSLLVSRHFVGDHIFSNAIESSLVGGITRVLVTHHVHLLSRCDTVIVLEHGRIKHHGRYADLIAQGVDFAGAVDVSKTSNVNNKADDSGVTDESTETKKEENLSDEKKAALLKSGKKLVKEEERAEGSVEGSAYLHYARAGGLIIVVLVFVVQGFGRACEVFGGFWLSIWAERSRNATIEGNPFDTAENNRYVGIYALFGVLGVLGLTGRGILIAIHRLHASRLLHDNLTDSVLRAPVAFFDVTPTGRILNRFAADMDKIDLELTQSLSQGISTIFSVVGALAAICVATKGTFLVPLVPMTYLYYLIQKWFRKTSTELQRLNSIANSPIFADFSMTLSGTSTIRAYGEEKRFFETCKSSFDTMNASYVLVQMTGLWLGLRLDVLGGLIGVFVGGVAVATSDSGFIPAGWLGLALSYSIEITNFLKHGVRMMATVEAQMNSVERVLFYSNNIDSEAPAVIPETDPPPGSWPSKGEIELRNASMRYRDGPLVLKDISLKVKAGEKVGKYEIVSATARPPCVVLTKELCCIRFIGKRKAFVVAQGLERAV